VNISVTVVYSPAPREIFETTLVLPQGSSLARALNDSECFLRFPAITLANVMAGIWGQKATLDHVLTDGDRVEIYRPLTADPMEARRTRFKRQGARTTGLFAQKRAGAKSGY
jgi:putative ubiquitin-RnfH superfamily antitoxin RatB of RatAB toxin-antitoxin module